MRNDSELWIELGELYPIAAGELFVGPVGRVQVGLLAICM